jgi:transposase
MQPKFSALKSKVDLLLKANTSIPIISTTLKRDINSIYEAIKRIKSKNKDLNIERARAGRVKKITPRAKRVINRDLIKSPKKENKRLLLENNLGVAKRTLQSFLKEEGYSFNKATKKPLLNKEKAYNRLLYAKEKAKNLENIDFSKVIFSNKSAIQRGHGSRGEYYRKKGNSKVGKEMVSTKNSSKYFNILSNLKKSSPCSLSFYNFTFLITIILI